MKRLLDAHGPAILASLMVWRLALLAGILGLTAAWWFALNPDGTAACAAVQPSGEYGTAGLSWFPPGYNCAFTNGRNTVEPFDREGWATWAVELAVVALAATYAVAVLVGAITRLAADRRGPRTNAKVQAPADAGRRLAADGLVLVFLYLLIINLFLD